MTFSLSSLVPTKDDRASWVGAPGPAPGAVPLGYPTATIPSPSGAAGGPRWSVAVDTWYLRRVGAHADEETP